MKHIVSCLLVLLAAFALPASAATVSDNGPEADLEKVFAAIDQNQLDVALDRTEALLKVYPNFRLANLIKGDLLLARAQPLTTFGNVRADKAQIADLRDEAIVRLRAYREKPNAKYVPRYLMQMGADQKYAVVVDTRRARLYVYRNDNGTPRFVADFYASHGKAGAEKMFEGDMKTPVGVYHVVSQIDGGKLPELYGDGAFPINYPNPWDKRLGRTGYGIWLHGVPYDTYSRPPKASEGCVVLANQDFNALSNYVQVGLTPVIISNEIEWLNLDDWQSERTSLNAAIEAWRQDWESRDVERYLAHYAREFKSDNQNLAQWKQRKRAVGRGKSWIKVGINRVSMLRSPGNDGVVEVIFEQEYKSNNFTDTSRKRQYWIKENGQWRIAYEGAA
ncbi:L,D-transpeptidase family protein [Nitrogeniibacter aestuarii]|uniref:L,D-transpeptidase family protein n=1 Tax=Nitrogeniibacter aestuarii TaxID=2815343 RepID=UPI001E3E91E1|nr:L,D-transpeptidase [Nitrogeniibacter aestuarii]